MWFTKSKDEVIKDLQVNTIQGLSTQEAKERLSRYGENKLATQKNRSLLQLFFAQLNDAMIYVLLGAALISAILGELSDAIIIAVVILINAVVGLIQEYRAEQALEALKKLSTPKSIVKRDGKILEIPSEEVVPGDIVIIDAGRYIPCDLRLIETVNLQIDESALTGESVPVDKNADLILETLDTPLGDQKNMAFMSTFATYGRGVGVAVATGMKTEIGKIAKMLEETDTEQTPLQKKLTELSKILGFAALGISIAMFLVGIIQGRPLFEMFFTAISLAVAAIPEGLPAIVTIVLAMGVQRMVKKHAIIRKLPAVETLGSVNIICSDKTGTLTQNKMTVVKFYADNAFGDVDSLNINNPAHKLLLESLVLCNDATYSQESKTGDPTETALLEMGAKFNIFKTAFEEQHPRVNEVPFDSDRKLMSTVNKYDNEYLVFTKGAPDNLLKICNNAFVNGEIVPLTQEIIDNIMDKVNSMSQDALRVLGAAFKKIDSPHGDIDKLETDLTFIGLIGMIDPPRLEVKDSIFLCKQAGIKTIMITGDHKNTAFAIAKELGITDDPSQVISGVELDKLTEEELISKIDNLRVFARVSPEHKVKIVRALKAKGSIVAMTGDGVNDAPSLKAADIGIAMGITGTDVAKGASDMVLTDDNFSTIVSAVEEGRNIYNNIKKSIVFLLSCNIGEIITLFFAILFGWATPLKPIHILWVNLITDTFPALSLGVEPGDKDVMKEKPRNPNHSLFAGGTGVSLILNGALIGLVTLTAFVIGARVYTGTTNLFPIFPSNISDDALTHAQTMAFVVLSVSQLIHSLNMRHPTKSIFQVGWFTNKYLIASILFGIFLQEIVITVPFLRNVFGVFDLRLYDWSIVVLLSIVPLVVNEIVKIFIRHKVS